MTTRYMTGDGEGGDLVIKADSAEAAAREWAEDGDWGEGKICIDVRAVEVDDDDNPVEDGDEESVSMIVGSDPRPPECTDDHGYDHDWVQERMNSLGGTQIATTECCSRCGAYRHYRSESTPGNYPETPSQTTYGEPDEQSWQAVRTGVRADLDAVLAECGIDGDDLRDEHTYDAHCYVLPVETEDEREKIADRINAVRPDWCAIGRCETETDSGCRITRVIEGTHTVEIEIPIADHDGYEWTHGQD